MVRTQIQLTEKQIQLLKEAALHEKRSMADLIRQAIDAWMRGRPTLAGDDRRERALTVMGRYHSGSTDVSEHHDDYLVEAFR